VRFVTIFCILYLQRVFARASMLPQRASSHHSSASSSSLPSPQNLFSSSTSSPSPFEAVYRSIEVEALPVSQLHLGSGGAPAQSAKAKQRAAAAAAPKPTVDRHEGFPQLAWPLDSYPRGQFCSLRDEDPAVIVAHVEKRFQDVGCTIDRKEDVNALVITAPPTDEDQCRSATFSISVWDVSKDPAAMAGKSMVDITRLSGCPFLFHDTVLQALGGSPNGKRFRCLNVPQGLAATAEASPIRAACVESALDRCLNGTPQERVQGVCSLANLCQHDAAVREAVLKVDAKARLAPLRDDPAVKKHAERLLSILAT